MEYKNNGESIIPCNYRYIIAEIKVLRRPILGTEIMSGIYKTVYT